MMHAPTPEPRTRPDAFVELHQVTHAYGRGDKQVKALDATDHAPHAPEEKTRNDIWTSTAAFPGSRRRCR